MMVRVILLASLWVSGPATASGAPVLDRFMTDVTGLSGRFVQTVRDDRGEQTQSAAGRFALQRPNQFRWDYVSPYEQQIIGDGKRVWWYDADLAQVTVRVIGDVLAGSPAALLSGDATVLNQFDIEPLSGIGSMERVRLVPRSQDGDFSSVVVAFRQGVPDSIELTDRLDQVTLIRFEDVTVNPDVGGERFRFVVPEGVDVVGDAD